MFAEFGGDLGGELEPAGFVVLGVVLDEEVSAVGVELVVDLDHGAGDGDEVVGQPFVLDVVPEGLPAAGGVSGAVLGDLGLSLLPFTVSAFAGGERARGAALAADVVVAGGVAGFAVSPDPSA